MPLIVYLKGKQGLQNPYGFLLMQRGIMVRTFDVYHFLVDVWWPFSKPRFYTFHLYQGSWRDFKETFL